MARFGPPGGFLAWIKNHQNLHHNFLNQLGFMGSLTDVGDWCF